MLQAIIPREILCKSALNKTGIPGYAYGLNPYTGCAHGCVYCYASFMCRFSQHQEPWGKFVDVKINFPHVLDKELKRSRIKPKGKVLFGTVTDAYQPAEAVYQITRASLEILEAYQLLEPHILTKSALVQRDIPILRWIRGCEVGFTITTLDASVAAVLEPGASGPDQRLQAAGKLMEAGIPVWIFIAPLLPGLSDTEEKLAELFLALQHQGIREILVDRLNPYPAVVHRLKPVYRQRFPEALPALEAYLKEPDAAGERIRLLLENLNHAIGCQAELV
jgi:DNA repair photolyase